MTARQLRTLFAGIEKPAGIVGCWRWTRGTNADGYASFGPVPAHRAVYELLVGPIPPGHELDHLCRVRNCVNPHHLEPVTRSENRRRIHRQGPWELRRYCRRGHAVTGRNRRVWRTGTGRPPAIHCYLCHDGERKAAS